MVYLLSIDRDCHIPNSGNKQIFRCYVQLQHSPSSGLQYAVPSIYPSTYTLPIYIFVCLFNTCSAALPYHCMALVSSVALDAVLPSPCMALVSSVALDAALPYHCMALVSSVALDAALPYHCMALVSSVALDAALPYHCMALVSSVALDAVLPLPLHGSCV